MTKIFFQNVERLVANSDRFPSRERLSAHITGRNPKYLSTAQRKGSDVGLSKAKAIADALEVPLMDLLTPGARPQRIVPDIFDFMSAHHIGNGRLEEFGDLIEYADIYNPPKAHDQTIRPVRIGKNSLAAKTLDKHGVDAVQEALLSSGNNTLDARLKTSYDAALAGMPIISTETLDEKVSVPPFRITLQYVRLLLAVHDDEGSRFVLNYCIEL